MLMLNTSPRELPTKFIPIYFGYKNEKNETSCLSVVVQYTNGV